MTNKTTKSSLLLSSVSLLLCFAMLLGTTFAWFTDSATSANNIIKSGNLDVTLHYADGTEAVPTLDTDWTDASTEAIFNYENWEPGYTDVKHIKIGNVGTLALKYQFNIAAESGISKLADVIDVYFIDPAAQVADRTALDDAHKVGTLTQILNGMPANASGTLEAGQADTVTIALKMQESAGNEYQDLTFGKFSVKVLATQLEAEEDSFGSDYDADATIADVTAYDATELQTALDEAAAGETTVIALANDIAEDITITRKANTDIVIDGNGKTVSGAIILDGKSAQITSGGVVIQNVNFKDANFEEDAFINLGNGTNATRYVCNVTVKNCTFDADGKVGVKSYTGGDKNIKIIGCTATEKAHSLAQLKGVDGVLVENCTVNSKNGINFNNSTNVTVSKCTVNTKGYAVRFGESKGGSGAAETYLIKDCTLKSANDDGDATIILRGTADYSTLTIQNTTIEGTPDITNTATGATVIK